MSDEERKQKARLRKIETARELEGRGFIDQAVQGYLKAEAPEEAARALRGANRPSEAAATLLLELGVDLDSVANVAPERRPLALLAADCFEQAGDTERASRIRSGLGAPAGSGAPPAASAPPASSARSVAPSTATVRPEAGARSVAPSPASVDPGARSVAPAPSAQPSPMPEPSVRSVVPPAGPTISPIAPSAARSIAPSSPPPSRSIAPVVRVAQSDAAPSAAVPTKPPSERPPPTPRATPASVRPPPTPRPTRDEDDDDELHHREQGWRGASAETVEQSIQQMLAAGRKGAAARVAWDAGQLERALGWFEELDMPFQAGSCLAALGRKQEALEHMLREPEESTRYRKVCFAIVNLAHELGRLEFDTDRYLNRFIQQGPADKDEIAWFLRLAELYRKQGFERGAQRCLAKVLETDPQNEQAREQQRAASAQPQRPAGPSAVRAGLPPLMGLEEFAKLAREHAPRKAPVRP